MPATGKERNASAFFTVFDGTCDGIRNASPLTRRNPCVVKLIFIGQENQRAPGSYNNQRGEQKRRLAHCKALARELETFSTLEFGTALISERKSRGVGALSRPVRFCGEAT